MLNSSTYHPKLQSQNENIYILQELQPIGKDNIDKLPSFVTVPIPAKVIPKSQYGISI